MTSVQLADYRPSPDYTPGAPWLTQLLWYYFGAPLVATPWLPISPLKAWTLRRFGAHIGQGVTLKPGLRVKFPWRLTVGDHSWLGENLWIDNLAPVTIADNVCLSQGVYLCTGNHDWSQPSFDLRLGPIHLQSGSWVAAGTMIGPGVTVGAGAVLTLGSVTTQSLQPWTIYSGNPAQPIKQRVLTTAPPLPSHPKVSLITVTYNSAATLTQTLQSVQAQDYPHIEHIVIDGGSTDGTLEIIQAHRHHLAQVISEPDRGMYDALNKGLALATGDLVGMLNSDDTYAHPQVISTVVTTLQATQADCVFADLVYVSPTHPDKILRYYSSAPFTPRRFASGWMPAHPTVFIKRWAYDRYGPFKTDYKIAADYELLIRFLAKHHLPYTYVPQVWVNMRAGGISTRNLMSNWILNREIVRGCAENGIRTNLFKVCSKYFTKVFQLVRRPG
ncbi:MAG: WcaF family extracellular polysaccharide biosynthesis acetyltransferase [Nodosilinea sp. LVE1205-7]|jgi:acetyltransferase-like isoleucine patch superfamily enzyme